MAAKKEVSMAAATSETPKAAFELPKFEMPNFEMPKVEVPAALREYAEKGVAQAKESYEKLKAVAEEATDLVEDTYATCSKGAVEFSGKVIENAKTNTTAAFDFAKEIMSAKSVAEFVEKQTAFARAQFETLTAQTKELQAFAQKIANDTAAPYKAAAEKAFAQFKKSA